MSARAQALDMLLRAARVGHRTHGSAAIVDAFVAHRQAHPPTINPPLTLTRNLAITSGQRRGWPIFEVGQGPSATTHVFYVHGGGFVEQINKRQWKFILGIHRDLQVPVTIPIYPLVPDGVAATVVPTMSDLLADLLERTGDGRVVVVGGSAGGGLALAATQAVVARGGPRPRRLVLISPWLDVTMTDPRIPAIAPTDPTLRVAGSIERGRLWAGALATADPLASPLFGPMDWLPPLTIFAGTHDILYPDSVRLGQRARAAGIPVDLQTGADMMHGWPVTPTPEGHAALRAVKAAIIQ